MSAQPPAQPLVAVEDIHTFYGKSHILHGVSLGGGQGRGRRSARAQRRRQEHHAQDHHGARQPSQGQVRFEGKPITALPAHKLARLGIGYVPEDRRIFKLLTVMENLRTGLDRSGVTEARKQELLDKVFAYFPRAGRAAQPGRRHAVGRRAADAGHRPRHDAGAQDHPARRADRRSDAAHGLADQARSSPCCNREGVAILLVEQNVPLTLEASQRVYFMEKGAVRHHAVGLRAQCERPRHPAVLGSLRIFSASSGTGLSPGTSSSSRRSTASSPA